MYPPASYNSYPELFNPHSTPFASYDNEDDASNRMVLTKHTRTIPVEEKDAVYFEKRARNNDSAKRSRDARRMKEQQIQDRVNFLEHENSRLLMENQAIRYQLSQLHTLCTGVSKSIQ